MSEQEPFDCNDFYILGNSYLTMLENSKSRSRYILDLLNELN